MEIKRVGSQASGSGSAEYFTGAVRIDPLFEAKAPALRRARLAQVSRLNPALGSHGTPIRSARPSL
jgi:hypothetical protein